jgi:hypothetical protein
MKIVMVGHVNRKEVHNEYKQSSHYRSTHYALANIWSSLSNTLNNKQSNLGAWPAPIVTATQFQIKTDAAELSFSCGDKVIFTLSPGSFSFNATF